jgi:hypothetical protein
VVKHNSLNHKGSQRTAQGNSKGKIQRKPLFQQPLG